MPFLFATVSFLNNLNIRSCKTLRRTQIRIMTSYYAITLIVKNTKQCLQSHQIWNSVHDPLSCLRHKLLDVGAISSSCVPVCSLLNGMRNPHTHTSQQRNLFSKSVTPDGLYHLIVHTKHGVMPHTEIEHTIKNKKQTNG